MPTLVKTYLMTLILLVIEQLIAAVEHVTRLQALFRTDAPSILDPKPADSLIISNVTVNTYVR